VTVIPALPPTLADFGRRGFRLGDAGVRERLEGHAAAFLDGYDLVRRHGAATAREHLGEVAAGERGFAYEGAGLAAALADLLRPAGRRRRHVDALLAGPGGDYVHLVAVGAGWVGGFLPYASATRRVADPLYRWLGLDGAGFARGFLRGRRWIIRLARRVNHRVPAHRVICQGAGRSLWFVECGDVEAISWQVDRFPYGIRRELWAGVGLAACYAGGVTDAGFALLAAVDGPCRDALAQGIAFAAAARCRSGHVPDGTRRTVAALAGVSLEAAAAWTATAEAPARAHGAGLDAYLGWQAEIRDSAAGPAH